MRAIAAPSNHGHATPWAAAVLLLAAGPDLAGQDDGLLRTAHAAAQVPGATQLVPSAAAPPPAAGSRASQMPGWPITVGGHLNFAPRRGVVLADLDGDGPLEVLMSSTDNRLYAWDFAGRLLPGFPVLLNNIAQDAPSVADLEGDGDLEIVQGTRGFTTGGLLYVIDHRGQVVPGFPRSLGGNNLSGSPSLFDLDDDGALEIVVSERAWPIGYLHVFEADGSEWGGAWPVALDHVPTGTAAIGDVDQDGSPEIAYLSYDSMYLLEVDGSPASGWPVQIANANFSYQSPALADLDGNGDLELAVGAHQSASGYYVFDHDGSLRAGWPKLVGTWTYCPPTIADLEGDGLLEILGGREGTGIMPSAVLYAWTADGVLKPGFPVYNPSTVFGGGSGGAITVADVDDDGRREIFVDHNVMEGGQGFLIGVDAAGSALPGFPLRPRGFTYMNGATVGDVDGDGDVELAVVSHDGALVDVNLYDLDGAWHPRAVAWEAYHHHARRGGLQGSADALHVQGPVALGQPVSAWVVGPPAHQASLWASLATALPVRHPAFGWFYLDRPFWRTFLAGSTIPAAGEIELATTVPQNPALRGRQLFLQALTRAGAQGSFSNLLARTIR